MLEALEVTTNFLIPIPSDPASWPDVKRTTIAIDAAIVIASGNTFNVMAYGAKADGITDDAAAFADAITAATVEGGKVIVPPGSYLLGSALAWGPEVTVEGAGIDATTLIRKATFTGTLLSCYGELSNCTIDGNYPARSSGTGDELDLLGTAGPTARSVKVINPYYIGIFIVPGAIDALIEDCVVIGSGITTTSSVGIWCDHTSIIRPVIRRSVIENCSTNGIYGGATDLLIDSCHLQGNHVVTSTDGGQIASGGGSTSVRHTKIGPGGGSGTLGIEVFSGVWDIDDCPINGQARYGIGLAGSPTSVLLTRNRVSGSGTADFHSVISASLWRGMHNTPLSMNSHMNFVDSYVGINTTVPVAPLTIGTTPTTAPAANANAVQINGPNSTVGSRAGNLQVMTIDSAAADIGGSIGLGGNYTTNLVSARFASIAGRKENSTAGDFGGYFAISTSTNGAAETEKLRVTSAGNLVIGATTASARLHVVAITEQMRLAYDAANYTSFTVDSAGNLLVAPTGDWIFNAAGKDILPSLNYDQNLGALTKKYLALHAAELRVETLVAAETLTMISGHVLIGVNATLLIADLSAVATTIDVKHNGLVSGNRVLMLTIGQVEFLAITSGPTTIAGGYRYSVTRDLDDTGANSWPAGSAVMNTGSTGDGHIELYAERGVKSAAMIGPTIVGNVRNSATYNDWTEHWAIGNLNGLYGYSSTAHGVAFGKYADSQTRITIDSANGYRVIYGKTTPVVLGQWDTSGVITIGEVAASKVNTLISAGALSMRLNTTPFFSIDTSGNVTMGNVATNQGNAYWNNSNKRLEFRGSTSGTVVQAYIDTDGAFNAGGGAAVMDADGLSLDGGTSTVNQLKWKNGATVAAAISTESLASGTQTKSTFFVYGASISGYFQTKVLNSSSGEINFDIINIGNASTNYMQMYGAASAPFAGLLIGGTSASTITASTMLDVRGSGLFSGDLTVSGLLKAGSAPTTLTNSTGKVLLAALENTGAASTYTPTVTAGSGSFTTLGTITGRYKLLSTKLCWVHVDIPVTTNGTAGTYAICTLPFTAVNTKDQTAAGRENGVTSKVLNGGIPPNDNKLYITFYDATYPGANGARFTFTFVYEIA